MKIDFSAFDTIIPSGPMYQQPEKPAPVKEKPDAGKLQTVADQVRRERQQNRDIIANNIKANREADKTLEDIIKGLKAGKPIELLFLQACQALTAIKNEAFLMSQIRQELTAVYGAGLGEPGAIDAEIEQIQGRLLKLKQAATSPEKTAEKQKIQAAILAHEAELKRLEAMKKA